LYFVLLVSAVHHDFQVLYALSGTRYGQVIPIFRVRGERESFKVYVEKSLKADYTIRTMMIVADNLDQVYSELTRRELIPGGQSRVAMEGTDFFDEVFAELMTGTIWIEEGI
jgi:hypothetical protein